MNTNDFLTELAGAIGKNLGTVGEIRRVFEEIDTSTLDADARVFFERTDTFLSEGSWSLMSSKWDIDALSIMYLQWQQQEEKKEEEEG